MTAETDDAFRQLNDPELAALRQFGVRRAVSAGEYLYREGDAGYDFYVVLAGAVEIVVNSEGKERVIARHSPGRFLYLLNRRIARAKRLVVETNMTIAQVAYRGGFSSQAQLTIAFRKVSGHTPGKYRRLS